MRWIRMHADSPFAIPAQKRASIAALYACFRRVASPAGHHSTLDATSRCQSAALASLSGSNVASTLSAWS
ncbi:hypothetical protein LMG31886_00730 [Xanthomonas hydrangeae]|nr:hypothetical protein LMG31884_00720 [Xanthomonas hydrangeae]CAD7712388.1 hypothetical protein LMG31884_00720 [Xanthomonas hydrangeae]CAD7717349.1 hypothetical protein LMG31887_00720 [Xanthomonas hydrangeae]CAD7717351.1 hypothetical protein LMG31887_00720 [Xanthomonas hydrangeae]CAD7719925.1 hypothetical protein LMG31886_00730 [Xanthomonas hydrangeae]